MQMGHASPKITLDVYARLFERERRAEQAKARMQSAYGGLLERVRADDTKGSQALGAMR
jgi:hypothetical protein